MPDETIAHSPFLRFCIDKERPPYKLEHGFRRGV